LHIPPSYITSNLPPVASLLVSPIIPTSFAIRYAHRRKRFEEERKEELEQIKGEGLAESLEKVKMELNEHTLLATRGAAGHFQKGQGTRRKTETIRKKKNDRLSASGGFGKGKAKRKGKEKEKERGGGATAGAEKRTKSGKIIKTHDTKVSTNGILSWIPSDSLAVRAFLEETKWEEGVEGGVPEVPWHLFATDKGDRNVRPSEG